HDTTASAICWALYNLARHAHFQERCRQEVMELMQDQAESEITCFSYTENIDYGAFLEGVNGLFGDSHTYWQLLVQLANGTHVPATIGLLGQAAGLVPFTLEVKDNQPNSPTKMYSAHSAFRGVLFGGMTRLASSDQNFSFSYTENIDYGAFLEGVNGLFGDSQAHTYWQLLVQLANGTHVPANVGLLGQAAGLVPFTLEVKDNQPNSPTKMYSAHSAFRGVLFGGMTRLASSDQNFSFSYTENIDYGAFLEGVNGLFGDSQAHTYWRLLVQLANGTHVPANVGISCYIPRDSEVVILNYTTW
ncbi:hypothetical protein CRUP_005782, partial [Coryphaenoides rupestris]